MILGVLADGPATLKRIQLALLGLPDATGRNALEHTLAVLCASGLVARRRPATGQGRAFVYRLACEVPHATAD